MDFYHLISQNICVFGCNLCRNTCPANSPVITNQSMEAYACWSLDDEKRKSSSSGGIASIFYGHFLKNKNGIAYGCNYDDNLHLQFSRASKLDEIEKFKTSKYTFSHIRNTFKEIKKDLVNNNHVVFIGTPCQVAGLKNFLNKDYKQLLCIDLICHGMPPEQYLSDYIDELNLSIKPDNLTFRGINNFYFTLYSKNKIIYSKKSGEDKFFKAFLEGLFYRKNCYSCKYASDKRVRRYYNWRFLGIRKRYSV